MTTTVSLGFYDAGWDEDLTLVSLLLIPVFNVFEVQKLNSTDHFILKVWKYGLKSDVIDTFIRRMHEFPFIDIEVKMYILGIVFFWSRF